MKRKQDKKQIFQYKKVTVKKNPYIDTFYVIMANHIQMGYTIQDEKTAKSIMDWLNSVSTDECTQAEARLK